jgi:hypothetical protein
MTTVAHPAAANPQPLEAVLGRPMPSCGRSCTFTMPARAAEREQIAAARARAQDFTREAVGARRRGHLLALAACEQQGPPHR